MLSFNVNNLVDAKVAIQKVNDIGCYINEEDGLIYYPPTKFLKIKCFPLNKKRSIKAEPNAQDTESKENLNKVHNNKK